MDAKQASYFCGQLDSIDDLIDEINSDGSTVIEKPGDMAAVLERLAAKFGEVRDAAPTPELLEACEVAWEMLAGAAAKLREFPPDAKVEEAAEFSGQALAKIQEFAPAVLAFRREHCEEAQAS
jgi:hypothetical protein